MAHFFKKKHFYLSSPLLNKYIQLCIQDLPSDRTKEGYDRKWKESSVTRWLDFLFNILPLTAMKFAQ